MSVHRLFPGLLIVLLALAGCNGLQFRNASVLDAKYDENTRSTRVTVTFEVWDRKTQLLNLPREAFSVDEDGVAATSETMNQAASDERRTPVLLVLDTSFSMYQANAVAELKQAASRFITGLEKSGFQVTTYQFADEVTPVTDLAKIPDQFDAAGSGGRWTSLYAAIHQGFAAGNAIVVVFSDGADNYSQNHGIADLDAILRDVRPADQGGTGAQRVVHTIAFGNVRHERDREGIPAERALQLIAMNGSFSFAESPLALDAVFEDLARRIRKVYIYDYYSPNLSGRHTLDVKVSAHGRSARTGVLSFDGADKVAVVKAPPPVNTSVFVRTARLHPGALVNNVARGSNAGAAGLRPGDIIQGFNGVPLTNNRGFYDAHSELAPGATVRVSVLRTGRVEDIEWKVGTCEDPACKCYGEPEYPRPVCGLVGDLLPRLHIGVNLEGARVVEVFPGPARDAGVLVGDQFVRIDDTPVVDIFTLLELFGQLSPATPIKLVLSRGGAEMTLEIMPVADP